MAEASIFTCDITVPSRGCCCSGSSDLPVSEDRAREFVRSIVQPSMVASEDSDPRLFGQSARAPNGIQASAGSPGPRTQGEGGRPPQRVDQGTKTASLLEGCDRGHPLHKGVKAEPWQCAGRAWFGACRSGITDFQRTGMSAWSCAECRFDVCNACYLQSRRVPRTSTASLLQQSRGQADASSVSPRTSCVDSGTQTSEAGGLPEMKPPPLSSPSPIASGSASKLEGYGFEDPVWGVWQFPPDTEPTPLDVCCWAGCPCFARDGYSFQRCCGGWCCQPSITRQKKRGWKRWLCTFSMFFTLVQLALQIYLVVMFGRDDLLNRLLLVPEPQTLRAWGAKDTQLILQGEWYRLFAPIFLHGGIVHLAMNTALQLRTVATLEYMWGHWRFFIIYIGSGAYSFLCSAWLLPLPISVGCSGSIMGVIGSWFVYTWLLWDPDRDLMSRVIDLFYAGTAIIVVLSQSWLPSVDWASHIGGALSGVFLGMILFATLLKSRFRMVATLVAGLLLETGLVLGTLGLLLQVEQASPQYL